jgi:small redox-active disulfide protein 2
VLTYDAIKKVVEQSGAEVSLRKVEDIMEIMKYNVMTTPAVVVDGEVKLKGHVPSEAEIRKVLGL